MTAYISTYIVKAAPMTRGEYNKYRGWKLPSDESPDDAGYLVTHVEAGSESWIAKELFETNTYEVEPLEEFLPHQRRMLGERAHLKGTLRKLENAIKKPAFLTMPHADRQLLISQARAMTQYLNKLDKRIESFLVEADE